MRSDRKRPPAPVTFSFAVLSALLATAPVVAAAEPPKDKAAAAASPATHPTANQAQKPVLPQSPVPASPDSPVAVRVAIPAGPQKETLRRILLKPYATATGTDLADVAWDGSPDAMAKLATDQAADVVLVDGSTLATGCTAQAFKRLDWNRLGRARFLPGASSDCGAGAFMTATVLAWDREKLQGDPKPPAPAPSAAGGKPSPNQDPKNTGPDTKLAPDAAAKAPDPQWSDFWDVAKHPGRRGLQRQAEGNLEFALLADGVSPGDIYRTLRTGEGVDRAFRKLDQLKPYIMWWDQPGQPAQFLAGGKVLFTSAPASSLSAMVSQPGHARPGVQWAGSLNAVQSWAVPQSAHEEAALAALLIATDPAREVELARATGYGPSTTDAVALLPGDLRGASPAAAANLKLGLPLDEGFWRDNRKALEARFNDWVSK